MTTEEKIKQWCPQAETETAGETVVHVPADRLEDVCRRLHDDAEEPMDYLRDLVGSITRPVQELKGFQKVFLKAGESKEISFKITSDLLKFYDYDLDFVCEPGDFDVMIGGSSRDVKTARFTLQ